MSMNTETMNLYDYYLIISNYKLKDECIGFTMMSV